MAEKRRLRVMGQKVNPIGLRLGINKGWQYRWFATNEYAKLLKEDFNIINIIEEQFENAAISKIEMEADITVSNESLEDEGHRPLSLDSSRPSRKELGDKGGDAPNTNSRT